METKILGKILVAFSILGMVVSIFSGAHYYKKIVEMKQEIDVNLEVLYSMQGFVSKADEKISYLHDAMLLFSQKVDATLSLLDRFLSAINVLSVLGLVDAEALREGSGTLREAKDTIASYRQDIEFFRGTLTRFKTFLEDISILERKVDETAREAKTLIIIVMVYLCILNIIIAWFGLKLLKDEWRFATRKE